MDCDSERIWVYIKREREREPVVDVMGIFIVTLLLQKLVENVRQSVPKQKKPE